MDLKKIQNFIALFLKGVSAFAVAYVVSLIGVELINYGSFSFTFIFISIAMAFFFLVKNQQLLGILLVDLVLVAIAFVLRFYVVSAYGT